eukprot:449117-Prymnesium_polylepis.1
MVAAPYMEHRGVEPRPSAKLNNTLAAGGGSGARDIRFFFGGYTAREHRGYETRWAMFRKRGAMPNGTVLIADPEQPVVPLPRCNSSLLAPRATAGAAGGRSDGVAAAGARVACTGRYVAARMVGRAVFALLPRGDTATSRRLSDAMLYGAVPVILSDSYWVVGAPFRCVVPYRLFTAQVDERTFARDPARALRAVDALGPAAVSRMQDLIAFFREDLLWRSRQSR